MDAGDGSAGGAGGEAQDVVTLEMHERLPHPSPATTPVAVVAQPEDAVQLNGAGAGASPDGVPPAGPGPVALDTPESLARRVRAASAHSDIEDARPRRGESQDGKQAEATTGAGAPGAEGGVAVPPGLRARAGSFIVPKEEETMCCGVKFATKHYEIAPYPWRVYRADSKQVISECLAGITVALAQVSESIAFAFIAGVGPLLGLHAAWIIGFSLSVFGSRPGMINGATGVRAAVLAPYVTEHGVGMLFYIVCMISFFQALAAAFRIAKLVRLIPRPAMIGFVNGLAVILALGQIGQFQYPDSDDFLPGKVIGWMWFVVVVTVAASVFLPKIPKIGGALPPSLLGILAATIAEYAIVRPLAGVDTPTIGDIGEVSGGFPKFFWLDSQYDGQIPDLNWETVKTTIQPAFIAAAAGMVEAVMTMEVVNDLTETNNPNPNQQLFALSIGNFASGLLGTMGGGATIGLSMINCTNGANGRYRISGIVAAIAVLVMVLVAAPVIKVIPTASLVGVMVVVCTATFEWSSLPTIGASILPARVRSLWCFARVKRKIRRSDALVIVLVTLVTLFVDLFTAVAAGVLFTAAAYAWDRGHELRAEETLVKNADGTSTKIIHVTGDVFFASTMEVRARGVPCFSACAVCSVHWAVGSGQCVAWWVT